MIYHVFTAMMLIGILGLLAQVLLGGAHTGHAGEAGGHGAGGHGAGGLGHGGHGVGDHGIAGHGGGHGDSGHAGHTGGIAPVGGHHAGTGGRGRGSVLLTLLSPIVFFSLCIGIGGTGLLLKHFHLPTVIVAFAALCGGALFYGALIGPMWALVFKFASTPSTALEGAIAREAEAVSTFNAEGKGLVKLIIDGQFVQVLATLETDDREDAPKIARGDLLTVTSVDGRTNTCRVARL